MIRKIGSLRSLWKRLFYGCVLPVVLLYLLSNIALNSSWTKARVERALQSRTGQEWQIGTLNWTPNGNLHVRHVLAALGDGELAVEHIRLVPNWSKLGDRQLGFSSVEIENPSLDISQEWLLSKVGHVHDPMPAQEPEVDLPALANNAGLSSGESEQSAGAELADNTTGENTAQPIPLLPATGVKPAATAEANEDKEVYEYDAWLRISGASLKIRKDKRELLKIEGFSANIPYGGVDLEGDVTCAKISLVGRSLLTDSAILLHKKGPVLGLKETDLEFLGVEIKPKFQVVRGGDGFYFFADIVLPKQSVNIKVKHLDLTTGLIVQALEARVQGAGRIDKPLRWQGLAALQAVGVSVEEGHRGSLIEFDHWVAHSQLARGVVQVPKFQVMGEDLSILGNGVLTMNGIGFGVLRVVASPEKKGWIDKFTKGSQIIEGVRGEILRPLLSVDRYFMDLQIDGTIVKPIIKIDQVSDWQELWPALKRLKKFIKEERAEERQ